MTFYEPLGNEPAIDKISKSVTFEEKNAFVYYDKQEGWGIHSLC